MPHGHHDRKPLGSGVRGPQPRKVSPLDNPLHTGHVSLDTTAAGTPRRLVAAAAVPVQRFHDCIRSGDHPGDHAEPSLLTKVLAWGGYHADPNSHNGALVLSSD